MVAISTYGQRLFDLLPEVYRQRDHEPPGDRADHLKGYLDSHGVLLDRVRGTLEQFYADHFPDVPETGRVCQAWIIPYLADLVGAVPVSPFADGQRDEVANAIRWSKRKGTLVAVEEIVEAIALSEAEIHEGWRRVITAARPDDTILPATYYGEEPHPIDAILADPDPTKPFLSVNPQVAAVHPGIRTATLDLRAPSRAVRANRGEIGTEDSRFATAPRLWPRDDNAPAEPPPDPIAWRQHEPNGVPCFPGSYEDVSVRTVDARTPDAAGRVGRYHPKALIVFLPPPYGLCPPGPEEVAWPIGADWLDKDFAPPPGIERLLPDDPEAKGALVVRNATAKSLVVKPDLTIGPASAIRLPLGIPLVLEKLRFEGTLTLNAGTVTLRRSAVKELAFGPGPGERHLYAESVLFGAITGGTGTGELVYGTILDRVSVTAQLSVSEVIFPENTRRDSIVCARYSRLPASALDDTAGRRRATNTDASPLYVSPTFCTPGAGVLRPEASAALLEGAEDLTEMGAYHDWRYAALRAALQRKLADFLPMGIRPVIVWDERLLCLPPVLDEAGP
jgi:Phage tail protein (Tail_P2_I)